MAAIQVKWWREFDLTYWQMLSALGYPIPSRIEERWPRSMNAGNPFRCGPCEARNRFPGLHAAKAIYDGRELPPGATRDDFEHRITIALAETGTPIASPGATQ